MPKRRKYGEKFEMTYGQKMHLDDAGVEKQLAEYFYEWGAKHHQNSLRKTNLFWRQIRQENEFPKKSALRFDQMDHTIEVLKISDMERETINNKELERKTLELEILRLEKLLNVK